MNDKIIYENIFEAIRMLEASNPVLNLKDRERKKLMTTDFDKLVRFNIYLKDVFLRLLFL